MTPLEAALLDIASFLVERRVPYVVIGGFANLYWGRPRLTEDLDLKISLPEENWPAFVSDVRMHFRFMSRDPEAMLRELRVLPILTRAGVRVDLIVAGLPYEEQAIGRAVSVPIGGVAVALCSAEDLILHKIISDRARDREDVAGVIVRQGKSLDRSYLDSKVRELANGLERPDVVEYYEECLRKAESSPPPF